MHTFTPPIQEMAFALAEAGLAEVAALPAFEGLAGEDILQSVLDEAGKFACGVLAPINASGDRQGAQHAGHSVTAAAGFADAYQQFCEDGWHSLGGPTAHGGQGLPSAIAIAVNELWCAANLSFSLLPLLTQGATAALLHHASPEIIQQFVPKMISGVWSGTMNLTEPQAGSDLSQVRSKAEPMGDGRYRVFGQKIFITWGEHDCAENIIHLVLARLPNAPADTRGISLFVVPKFLLNEAGDLAERNDIACTSIEHKLGIHASPTCVMQFGESGAGAIGYLVGEENHGLTYMFTMMNHARLGVGVEGVALAERAYQQAVWFAKDRVQSRAVDSPDPNPVAIIQHPDVRRMLLLMGTQTQAMRAIAYEAAVALDLAAAHPDAQTRQAKQAYVNFLIPIVKGWCTEQVQEITSLGVQVHGGMGYIEETGAAQYLRDARITAIYEGTNGIQALDLLQRKLMRDQGRTAYTVLNDVEHIAHTLFDQGERDAATALRQALEQVRACTAWLLANKESAPKACVAGAFPYMMALGTLLGGAMLARQGIRVLRLKVGKSDFSCGKVSAVRFYAAHILPRVGGYAQQVTAGADTLLNFPEGSF